MRFALGFLSGQIFRGLNSYGHWRADRATNAVSSVCTPGDKLEEARDQLAAAAVGLPLLLLPFEFAEAKDTSQIQRGSQLLQRLLYRHPVVDNAAAAAAAEVLQLESVGSTCEAQAEERPSKRFASAADQQQIRSSGESQRPSGRQTAQQPPAAERRSKTAV